MAAAGIDGYVSVAAGTTSTNTIKPTTGQKWVIHNIFVSGACAIRSVNNNGGTPKTIEYDSVGGADSWQGKYFHISDTQWIEIRNAQAGTALDVNYDGVLDS